MPRNGTIRLFSIAGIDVFLHWSWFLVAILQIQEIGRYSLPLWSRLLWGAIEYLVLFAIVLLHEFGHALACRQVGGKAHQIVLWPLGGVAYVSPPPRPGATLWSLAAGPLVNVALMPVLGILLLVFTSGSGTASTDFTIFLQELNLINLGLFLFNVLPIYPLDGGQILRSLLWYVVGRASSLMAAVIVGFVGVAGLVLLAIVTQSPWLGLVAVFVALQCFSGYKQARGLKRLEDAPRHQEVACPNCKMNPPRGAFWVCSACQIAFDTFDTNATCPRCSREFSQTMCAHCGNSSSYADWALPPPISGMRFR